MNILFRTGRVVIAVEGARRVYLFMLLKKITSNISLILVSPVDRDHLLISSQPCLIFSIEKAISLIESGWDGLILRGK